VPNIDLMLGVEDVKAFQKLNMKMNKPHYTYMARMTHGRVVNLFQKYGARVHFNHMELEVPNLIDDLPEGSV